MAAATFEERDISPVTVGDSIHRKNVVSKSFVCPQEKVGEALTAFLTEIINAQYTPAGLPFFILDSDPENDWIKIQFFISIEHTDPQLPDGLHFDSYFSMDNMAALCVARNPEKNMPEAYKRLFGYLKAHSYTPVTPVFQVLGGSQDLPYTILKVGYREG